MTFEECRDKWREDIAAMKANTYTAPLPHPKMFDWSDPSRVEIGKKAAAARWASNQ